jgi:Tfp pilus assembly protein PilX
MKTSSPQGSAILVVMLFTTILGLIGASLLVYSRSEHGLNHRNKLRFQAKNAAEAALEYGAAEISARLSRNLNYATNELETSPLTTHSTRLSSLLVTGAGQYNNVDPGSVTLWASQISEPTRRRIDPLNPGNDYDPLRGQTVNSQSVRLLARATATGSNGAVQTSYATQSIEIRDAALFSYAIFYNTTMEFHPSPKMTINGPVHSNKDSYLTEGAGIDFMDTFTTAGQLRIGTIGSGRPGGKNIKFTTGIDDNGDGKIDLVGVDKPTVDGETLTTWVDADLASRDADKNFRDAASQIWNGNVQDVSHGITEQHPPGVLNGADAYKLIEAPDATATANATIEAQKYSNKAGLYVVVENDGNALVFHNAEDAAAYKTASNRATWRNDNKDKIVVPPAGMIKNNRRMKDFREDKIVNMIDIDLGVMKSAVETTTTGASGNFKIASDDSDWPIDDANAGWNGIVYVDVESPTTGFSSTSDVSSPRTGSSSNAQTGSGNRTAVRLINGSDLPNRRDVNPSNSFLPEGLTVATNAPIYVAGHYNADGTLAADLSDTVTPDAGEVPASIIADAINVLSQAWVDAWGIPVGDGGSANSTRPSAAHTEVSAAFLTGIVTTKSGNNSDYSGGVENYPRFHENWSNKSLRYRGSIVALFESQIATGKWNNAKYGAPKREWGFNSMFGQERRYPPGTPIIRTFRRLDYRDLPATDFNTLLADPDLDFAVMEPSST